MLVISIVSGAITGIIVFELFKRKLKKDMEINFYRSKLEKVLLERRIVELRGIILELEKNESDRREDICSLSRTIEIMSQKGGVR
ncbi:MAG: hypothetical protein ACRCZ0_06995 [Cetobacterium sp.]